MTEWQVVGVLLVLIGLVSAIITPIIKLNGSITRLNVTLEHTNKDIAAVRREVEYLSATHKADIEAVTRKAKEGRRELWQHEAQQDTQLADHEKRLHVIEHK